MFYANTAVKLLFLTGLFGTKLGSASLTLLVFTCR